MTPRRLTTGLALASLALLALAVAAPAGAKPAKVALNGAGGRTIGSWVLHERLTRGRERLPDRRRRYGSGEIATANNLLNQEILTTAAEFSSSRLRVITPPHFELHDHPLSFYSGPAGGGEPWVINSDTGIHPSVAGYAQMALQVPAP